MPEIRPFPGVLYRVPEGRLSSVLAPPYDVITREHQARLYERDPHNIVRVVLNRTAGEAGYGEAGETYRRWLAEGVLAADESPGLYVLEQAFDLEGRRRRRRGLLARFRAEDPGGSILPHEQTRAAPREDRYRVLRATRANFSPIFLMAADPDHALAELLEEATRAAALLSVTDEASVEHRLWRVGEPRRVQAFQAALSRARAYIADGHHRYATALRFRDETGPEGAWTLGYFTPLDDPGLAVLPYHRVLAQAPPLEEVREALAGLFLVAEAKDAAAAASATEHSTMPYAFGLAAPGGALVAEALPEAEDLLPADTPTALRALDTYFVHHVLLPRMLAVPDESVRFVHSLAEAEEALATGAAPLALLLRSTPVRQVVDVAEAGLSMPPKSTFFHPKLPSGLVVHPLAV